MLEAEARGAQPNAHSPGWAPVPSGPQQPRPPLQLLRFSELIMATSSGTWAQDQDHSATAQSLATAASPMATLGQELSPVLT